MERLTEKEFMNEMKIGWQNGNKFRKEVGKAIKVYFPGQRGHAIIQCMQDPIED